MWKDKPFSGGVGHQERLFFVLTPSASVSCLHHEFFIEMACNDLFGAGSPTMISAPDPDKMFTLKKADIAVYDREVDSLVTDLQLLVDMVKELPSDGSRSYEAMFAANEIVNCVDLSNRGSLKAAKEIADHFFSQRNGESQHTIVAVGNCHIDSAWLWPYAETKRKCARSFASALLLMERYPQYRFACSQAQQLQWIKEDYPSLFERIQHYARKGQFIPVGGTWVEMDGNLPRSPPPPLVNGRFATIVCWVAVFTCWIDVAASGNLDTSFPVIFKGNDQSHFGYTVEIISNRDGNLTLVGAIKDQSTSNFQGANHTGALHKCRLDTGGCTEVPIQRDASTDNIDSATAEYQYRELNDHMHLGMSLVSQPGPEGRVVVCAPKWKNQKYAETLYMLNGACYVMNKNLDDIKVLRPLIRKAFQVIEPETYLHALAEAGFSTHISQDNELILGTPGSMDWTGSLVTYGIPSDPEGELKLKVIGRLSTLKVPQIQQYIGYSVASGNFFESMGRSFVAGAPRDTADYRGAVYFFKPETPDSSNLNVQLKKEGEQMGSYFGASVLAIDLNMDNFTDLLVGAPLYSLQGTNGDEGKVYVYLSNGASLQLQDLKIMGSSVPGARFGSTIVNIGDLNLDGYPDVAIGSPYEHGYGAVYIYNGGKDGLKTTPAQIIEGRSTEGSPHGFGISISKAMDIDGNNYPDIVVGAYQSDQAYLFRAMPVVQARAWIEIDTKHVSSNKPNCVRNNVAFFCFPVTPCIQYDGKYVPEQIDFEFTIEMDTKKQEAHRGAFELLGGRTGISIREVRPLQRGRAMCFPQKALVFSNVQDLLTPFEFRLTFNISDGDKTRRDGFCSTCPVLDASTITTVTNRTVFQVACGPDNVCWADLILKASIVGHEDSSPLVVGKDNVVSLAINVKNRDDTEPAYLSRVEISLPENVDFVNIGTCESKGNATVSCDVGNPLNPGSEASVSIKLGLTKIKKKLEIHVAARTDSVDTDTSNNDITIALPVIYHADIGLQGSSSIGQLIYNESTGIVQVVHTFTMVKYFDSPINKVAVSISVPLKIHGKKDPFLKLEGVKPGKPLSLENLRPISLTSCLGKLLEKVVQLRLHKFLADTSALPDTLYGYRSGISTQDVLLRLQHDVLDSPSTAQYRAVLAADLKGAFDNLSHDLVLEQLAATGCGVKVYNYVRNFLRDRSASLVLGHLRSPSAPVANRGTPQGSVLSPLLFNLAMRGLPPLLDQISDVRHAIYADDITVWVTKGSLGHIETQLQEAATTIEHYARRGGLTCSPTKSELLIVTKHARGQTDLPITITLDDKPVPRKSAIRVLGFVLQSNAKATQTLHQLTTQCNQIMHMLCRVSNRRHGLKEADALRLVQALIHTRLTYHLPYHNLTQTEHTRMSVLLRKAQKLALGLPVRTATVCLERLGVTNTLEELMEAHRAAQLTRLRCTAQGRALLATLGFPPCPATLAAEGLSPAARARLTVAPIPRHMNPTRHSARRDHRSRYLRRAYPVGCDTVRALFTDASPQGVRGGITVVVDSDLRTVHAATERGLTDVSILEERAVARAILSTSFLSSSMPIHILTDSQTACRHFLYNTLHPSTASLLDPFLSSTSHNFRLIWVPGHAAVPGNERAHALARDLSHRAPGEDFVSIQPAPYSYSTHLAELRLARQHYPPPHPSLTRRDAVIWRQLQTNTFPTPLFYSYLHPSLSPPQCPHCGDRPNLFHMVWQCQLIPAVPPNSNPTPTSWEERLTDDTATGQQSLVDRAKAVAATYGAPD
ncbi:integrin alpha-4 [Ixodes scapularis]